MIECGSAKCKAPALYLCHWPGQPTELCEGCASWACKIADVMGFKLVVEMNVANRAANLSEEQMAQLSAYMMEQDNE